MWQDINTAPKDGTPVLVFVPSDYGDMMVAAEWEGGSWQLVATGSYAEDGDLYDNPTHWMPMPAKPDDFAYRKGGLGKEFRGQYSAHLKTRADYIMRQRDRVETEARAAERRYQLLKELARLQQVQL